MMLMFISLMRTYCLYLNIIRIQLSKKRDIRIKLIIKNFIKLIRSYLLGDINANLMVTSIQINKN